MPTSFTATCCWFELTRINYAVLIRIIPRSDLNGAIVVDLVLVVTNICSIRFDSSAGDISGIYTDEAAYILGPDDLSIHLILQAGIGNCTAVHPENAAGTVYLLGKGSGYSAVIGHFHIGDISLVFAKDAAGTALMGNDYTGIFNPNH